MAFASGSSIDGPPLLLEAAMQFETLDAQLARETYLDALFSEWSRQSTRG